MEDYVEYVSVVKRRAMKDQCVGQCKRKVSFVKDSDSDFKKQKVTPSLLDKMITSQLKEISVAEELLQQEKDIMQSLCDGRRTLMSVGELAKGITYTQPLTTGWNPLLHVIRMSQQERDFIRTQCCIAVDGEHIPPPILNFKDTRFPDTVLNKLKAKGILKPTPIQVQGLPVVLSGRDMIGIASTGSGKTLVFVLPMIMLAMQEELMMPTVPGEGHFGLIICPSRELAKQTHQLVQDFLIPLKEAGYPELRAMLCTGGANIRSQVDIVKNKGVHVVVATPGRLNHLLAYKQINLNNCSYLTLDEADRLLDLGFEHDITQIIDHFKGQRQTLLFSATMPTKVQNFSRTALVKPITVNVGGHVNAKVKQEVQYVKQEAKLVSLLQCLQKTPPPVIVFSESKEDVDRIHEYLLLKGVAGVAIHGGKDQQERDYAVASFKAGKKDVLVATDVASKGLDFPHIQHVINYDMPAEIENYVHRIGRTGRCGNSGRATTFVNMSQSETTLLDLKHLLLEAKQRIPVVLADMSDPTAAKGCTFCGGLGHRLIDCPKLEHQQRTTKTRKDYFGFGGYGGEI